MHLERLGKMPLLIYKRYLPLLFALSFLAVVNIVFSLTDSSSHNYPLRYKIPSYTIFAQSHYELGKQIGQIHAGEVKAFLLTDNIILSLVNCTTNTESGAAALQTLSNNAQRFYPQIWDELIGLSAGLRLDLKLVTIVNMRKELTAICFPQQPTPIIDEHCSDILQSGSHAYLAHNEDGDDAVRLLTFFIEVTLTLQNDSVRFGAFMYPGELPSSGFGYNSKGLVFTLNALSPVKPYILGLPRNFVSRDLLFATSLDDAIRRVSTVDNVIGHSYNLAWLNTTSVVQIETAPGPSMSSIVWIDSLYVHTNHYLHLDVANIGGEVVSFSSKNRLLEVINSEYYPPITIDDAKRILSSRVGVAPLFQTGSCDSCSYTLASAVFDIYHRSLHVYSNNMEDDRSPTLTLQL